MSWAGAARSACEVGVDIGVRQPCIAVMTGAMLFAVTMLGGGTHNGTASEVVLQVLAVPLVAAAMLDLIGKGVTPQMKGPLVFIAALVLLPMLQLIPLPNALWGMLPGRGIISKTYALIAEPRPALPLTLSPSATWASAMAMLPPLSIFLGCLLLTHKERRIAAAILIVVAAASVFLGLLQLAGGPGSPLRFYSVTNRTDAVGTFANRNHFAALLYATMVLAAYWLGDTALRMSSQRRRTVVVSRLVIEFLAAMISFTIILTGQLITRSRAGLVLSVLALIAGLVFVAIDPRAKVAGKTIIKIALATVVLVLAISQQFSLPRIFDRLPDSIAGSRATIAVNTMAAVRDYMPFVPVSEHLCQFISSTKVPPISA